MFTLAHAKRRELPMTTVTIPDKYVKALDALGDVQKAVDVALQRYTIEQITAKMKPLSTRLKVSSILFGN